MHDPFVHTRRDGSASDSPRAIASSANIPDYRIGKRRIVSEQHPDALGIRSAVRLHHVAQPHLAGLVPQGEAVRRRGAAGQRLRGDGIRVNAINADQIDTPLLRQFVLERAAGRRVSEEAQLEAYC